MKTTNPKGKRQADQSLQLLRPQEVADVLGISTRSLWRLRSAGLLPAPVRIGQRSVRWRLSDIQSFINQQNGESK